MTTPLPPSSVGIGSIYSPPSSSSSSSSTKLASLRTSPIAHFVSSPNDGYGYDEDEKKNQPQSSLTPIPTTGRLIAVNARYVVYAVRKGLVRVIDRRSASKALLRGHDEKSRLVDAAFFDGQSGRGEGGEPGVFGLWDELCMAHRNNRKKGDSANNNKATTKVQSTTTAAIDMLATLGGINDQASVLIWRLHSSGTGESDLGADKLMEIRLGGITNKIVWHPHDPNQFIVLHRNNIVGKSSGISFPVGTVATVVETAKLNVHLDEDEGHTVCEDPFSNGTKSLIVTDGRGGMGGANDIAWCGHVGLCYALTGHDDGCVRLWKDISSVGSTSREVPCMVTLDVASDLSLDDAAKRVTRVIFLSRYVTNMTSNRAITAPFIVGTAMNHTVSLWSSFSTSATGGNTTILQPACLRIFGLRPFGTNVEKVSNLMSLEICPAPYRPSSIVPHSGGSGGFLGGLFGGGGGVGGGENTVTEEDVQPPSSFVLLAERNVGVIHAVHIDSQWVEDGENYAVAVVGFDYVTTLNCVNPIYSLVLGSDVGNGTLMDERDVDLYCVQSKAVQMLSLTAGMVTPPGGWTDPSPGVTVLGSPVAVSGDELDVNDGDYEDYDEEEGDAGEDEFEDDYDVEGEGPDSGNDDEHDDDVVPTNSEPDSFSNWLCSIAVPTQKETPRAVSVPPGLSSTYLLPDQVMSSVDPPTTKNRGATSKSLSPMPPIAAISSSVANASKSSNKKNGQGGTKTSQPSSNQPIKILLKQEPKQELAFDPPSSVAVSVGSTTDIGAVLALQLKSHETQLLSSLQKTIVSEVASAVRSSFKDSQKATEQAIQRGFSSGFDTSQNSKLGKSLEKAAKDSAASAAKEAVASMQPLIMNALQQVSFSFKKAFFRCY